MFVQVIRGKTSDPDAIRRAGERWRNELMPGAKGFLGSTSGVTDDGTFINVVRFESAEAAAQNSARPEQDAFWKSVEPLLADVTFRESDDVDLMLGGGKDSAGFVQAMYYTPSDRQRLTELEQRGLELLAETRPDLIGSVRVWFDDGSCCDLAYFTSEADARAAEGQEPPPEFQEMFQIWGEVEFLDLRDPVLVTP